MKIACFGYPTRTLRSFGLTGLLVFGGLAFAPAAAKANLYNINATVGDILGTAIAGPDTNMTVIGTADPTNATPVTITVDGYDVLTGSCSSATACGANGNGFDEFATLNFGPSGNLLPSSAIPSWSGL